MAYRSIKVVRINKEKIVLQIDESEIAVSLAKLSDKLVKANQEELESFTISPSGYGIHWSLLDEDLSVDGIVKEADAPYGNANSEN